MSEFNSFSKQQCANTMCELKASGNMEEIERHSEQTSFVCSKCGAKADHESCLCSPKQA